MASQKPKPIVLDLEKVNSLNSEGCPACGKKFTLGDSAVLACGAWGEGVKYVHANEAVFDTASATYIERKCYLAKKS